MAILKPMPHVAKQIQICKSAALPDKSRVKQRHHNAIGMLYTDPVREDGLFPSASFVYLELQKLAQGWEDWKAGSHVFQTFLQLLRNENHVLSSNVYENLKTEIRYYLQRIYQNIPDQAQRLEQWYNTLLRFTESARQNMETTVFAKEIEHLELLWKAESGLLEQQIYEKWNQLLPLNQEKFHMGARAAAGSDDYATFHRGMESHTEIEKRLQKEIQREFQKIEVYCSGNQDFVTEQQETTLASSVREIQLRNAEYADFDFSEMEQYFSYLDAEEWASTMQQLVQECHFLQESRFTTKVFELGQQLTKIQEETAYGTAQETADAQIRILHLRDQFLDDLQDLAPALQYRLWTRMTQNTVLTEIAKHMGFHWTTEESHVRTMDDTVQQTHETEVHSVISEKNYEFSMQQQMELLQKRDAFLQRIQTMSEVAQHELIQAMQETPHLTELAEQFGVEWEQNENQSIENFFENVNAEEWVQSIDALVHRNDAGWSRELQREILNSYAETQQLVQDKYQNLQSNLQQIDSRQESAGEVSDLTSKTWNEYLERYAIQDSAQQESENLTEKTKDYGELQEQVAQQIREQLKAVVEEHYQTDRFSMQETIEQMGTQEKAALLTLLHQRKERESKQILKSETERNATEAANVYQNVGTNGKTETSQNAETDGTTEISQNAETNDKAEVSQHADVRETTKHASTHLRNQSETHMETVHELVNETIREENFEEIYQAEGSDTWLKNLIYLHQHMEEIESPVLQQLLQNQYQNLQTDLQEVYSRLGISSEASVEDSEALPETVAKILHQSISVSRMWSTPVLQSALKEWKGGLERIRELSETLMQRNDQLKKTVMQIADPSQKTEGLKQMADPSQKTEDLKQMANPSQKAEDLKQIANPSQKAEGLMQKANPSQKIEDVMQWTNRTVTNEEYFDQEISDLTLKTWIEHLERHAIQDIAQQNFENSTAMTKAYSELQEQVTKQIREQLQAVVEEHYQTDRFSMQETINQLEKPEKTALFTLLRQRKEKESKQILKSETERNATEAANVYQNVGTNGKTEAFQTAETNGKAETSQNAGTDAKAELSQNTDIWETAEHASMHLRNQSETHMDTFHELVNENIREENFEESYQAEGSDTWLENLVYLNQHLEEIESPALQQLLQSQYQNLQTDLQQIYSRLGIAAETPVAASESLPETTEKILHQSIEKNVNQEMSELSRRSLFTYLEQHTAQNTLRQASENYVSLQQMVHRFADDFEEQASAAPEEDISYETLRMPSMVVTRPQPPSFKNMPQSWRAGIGQQLDEKVEEIFQKKSIQLTETARNTAFGTDIRQTVNAAGSQVWKETTEKLEKKIKVQEKLLKELQENQMHLSSDEMMRRITERTIKEMHQELKLERMRRGLR